jgi:putative ABC transport system permease protein
MLKYNLLTSFRSIHRNLSFSLINISGLSLGLTLVILLLAWLQFEFSFDKFHKNADRIFRVVVEFVEGKTTDNFAGTPAPLGEALKNNIPEVVNYVRFGSIGRTLVNYENVQFWENIDLADSSIFEIFSFKLISGNPETALNEPHSVILSVTKARKYFGNKNPMGQKLLIGENKTPYTVTGIMKDIPANSQLQFDFLSSFSELKSNLAWGQWNYFTYILARNDASFRTITENLPGFAKKYSDKGDFRLHIQPLRRIHLHSDLRGDLATNRNIRTIYLVSSILVLVLIVACINYMNLATSRYTKRGKEVCLRKIAGATNSDLIGQFLAESFAITVSAFIIALLLSYLFMPVFISLTHVPLTMGSLFSFNSFIKFILLIILISFIAGSYPAFLLSSVNPVSTLHEDIKLARLIPVKSLRRGLVIFQFFISIVLIACTLVIRFQMALVNNKDLGLNPEQVILVPIYQAGVQPRYELYKKEILSSPFILNASAVAYYPGTQGYYQNAWWEGLQDNDISHMMSWIPVDKDFINTLKIEIIKGESFPEYQSGKGSINYILNESAAKMIGWKEPVGRQFEIVGIGRGKVIGIVKDFNFKALYSEIEPVALAYYPAAFDNLMIKISAENTTAGIEFIRGKWKNLFAQAPFEFSSLTDDIRKMYEKESVTLRIITYISIMALFISCIGLFGLVLFTIDNRIKEIGLRKVAGSTARKIVVMLNLEFIRWIIVSFIIACPLIIYFMQRWLENFAYRIGLHWWILAFAGIITVIISLLTVSWHTWHTAAKNPVECLRHE